MLLRVADILSFSLQTWFPLLDLLGLVQLCFHSLPFQTGFHFSLFLKSSIALLTFSVISMDENAEVLSDSSEPFRVRRYRRQLQEVLPFSAAAFHAVEGPPAESTVIPVHEITEEDDPAANSEALCIPHDPLVPATQSDSNLFDESALEEFSGFLPDSSALPLQDQVPSIPRCLVQHDSGVSVSGALSAELASTVPFLVVMGPPSSEQTAQTEVSGALLRSAWSTGKSVSRSRSRGPSLTLEPGCPKPLLFILCALQVPPLYGALLLDQFLRAEAIMLLTPALVH